MHGTRPIVSYMIYRMALFFNDFEWPPPNSDFKVMPLFGAEYLKNGTR